MDGRDKHGHDGGVGTTFTEGGPGQGADFRECEGFHSERQRG